MLILRLRDVVWVPLKMINQGYSKELKTVGQCWTSKNTTKASSIAKFTISNSSEEVRKQEKFLNIIKVIFKNVEIATSKASISITISSYFLKRKIIQYSIPEKTLSQYLIIHQMFLSNYHSSLGSNCILIYDFIP